MRNRQTKAADAPGTVIRATVDTCDTCYNRRGGKAPVIPSDGPVVPVKTFLRPSTYKQLTGHAANRGMKLPMLLSLLADASLKPIDAPESKREASA